MAETQHLRCQIKYEKGRKNFIDTLVEDVKPLVNLEDVEKFYFFWQEYSEEFERHIQLDLFIREDKIKETKQTIETKLSNADKSYYWEEEFVSTWYGLNEKESQLLIQNRCQNAKYALEILEAEKNGEIEHTAEELFQRNFHLNANQYGLTHWNEFKFCIKRAIEIPIIQLTHRIGGSSLYNYLFLRREMKNLDK